MFKIITPSDTPSLMNTLPGRPCAYHSGERLSSRRQDAMDIDGERGYVIDQHGDTAEATDADAGESSKLSSTGEGVASSTTFMRGHGTFVEGDAIVSSVCGTVERVNKLVSVRAVRTRYNPEVGDLVVGRVTEVGPRKWKVDIGSRQDAALALSSVNLPGGVQRRKLESDELQMRSFFQEGDLLVAEVQSAFADGSVGLHTRSLRYGKLRNGSLARVPPVLMQRLKSHFATLPCAVDLVLGLNGYVWVSKHILFDAAKAAGESSGGDTAGITKEASGLGGKGLGRDIDGVYSDVNEDISPSTRIAIARVCALLSVLATHHVPISDLTIARAYELSLDLFGLGVDLGLGPADGDGDDAGGAENGMGSTAAGTGVAGSLTAEQGKLIVEALAASDTRR